MTARPLSIAAFAVLFGLFTWAVAADPPDEAAQPAGDDQATSPRWVWGPETPTAEAAAGPSITRFRGTIHLVQPSGARLEVAAAGRFRVWLDGRLLGAGEGWEQPTTFTLQDASQGEHTVAVEVAAQAAVPALWIRTVEKPAYANDHTPAAAHTAGTDATWRWMSTTGKATAEGVQSDAPMDARWVQPDFDAATWATVQDGSGLSEQARLTWLRAAAQHPAVAAALLSGVTSLNHDQRVALRDLDQAWLADGVTVSESLVLALYSALALDADERSLNHLHQVFETFPERRHLVAVALARYSQAHRRRAADWRLLVRVLPIVQDDQGREIVAALLRYPERATRSRWLRESLLLGLKLGEDGGREALQLLEHWAGETIYQPDDDWPTRVAAAQAWFAQNYPNQPPPHLPAEGVAARWRYQPLVDLLHNTAGDAERGRAVFVKARCHLCHRCDGQGETLGPDLTGLGSRLQVKEMAYATIFPSEWVSDQYTTYTVETTAGRIYTGLIGRQGNDTLVVLESSGNKQFLPQRSVKQSVAQALSIMPSDLLEPLSEQEVVDLFTFLRRLSRADD